MALRERATQVLANREHIGNLHAAKHHSELLATKSGDTDVVTLMNLEHFCGFDQYDISCIMPIAIVDGLEKVKVEYCDSRMRTFDDCLLSTFELYSKSSSIGQTCQRIRFRQFDQLAI